MTTQTIIWITVMVFFYIQYYFVKRDRDNLKEDADTLFYKNLELKRELNKEKPKPIFSVTQDLIIDFKNIDRKTIEHLLYGMGDKDQVTIKRKDYDMVLNKKDLIISLENGTQPKIIKINKTEE